MKGQRSGSRRGFGTGGFPVEIIHIIVGVVSGVLSSEFAGNLLLKTGAMAACIKKTEEGEIDPGEEGGGGLPYGRDGDARRKF